MFDNISITFFGMCTFPPLSLFWVYLFVEFVFALLCFSSVYLLIQSASSVTTISWHISRLISQNDLSIIFNHLSWISGEIFGHDCDPASCLRYPLYYFFFLTQIFSVIKIPRKHSMFQYRVKRRTSSTIHLEFGLLYMLPGYMLRDTDLQSPFPYLTHTHVQVVGVVGARITRANQSLVLTPISRHG